MILSKFLEACLDNEIEMVRALLAEDVRLVNSQSEDGRYSASTIAVTITKKFYLQLDHGTMEIVKIILTRLQLKFYVNGAAGKMLSIKITDGIRKDILN